MCCNDYSMPQIKWERLNDSILKPAPGGIGGLSTFRAKVPGGWLVASGMIGSGVAFYPDFDHEWDGGSLR